MIYVMSDIHGCKHEFFKMLEQIEFNKDDTLYILGDIIDRGEGAFEILDYISDKENIKALMGNHEQMMICGLYGDTRYFNCWIENGGLVTYNQLREMPREKQIMYVNQVEKFSLCEEIRVNNQNYILVHAGIKVNKSLFKKSKESILKEQNEFDMLWLREDFYTNRAISKEHIIIFGHCATFEINARTTRKAWDKFYIWHDRKYKDKIGIDCGVSMRSVGGRLGCLRLDDMKEFYV